MFRASSQVESVEWLARMLALHAPLAAITGAVGSGKSIIAATAAVHLAESGYLIIPTGPPFGGPLDVLSLLAKNLGLLVEPQTVQAAVAVALSDRLQTRGVARGAVLLIDGAERLSPDILSVLQEIHLLVNVGRPRLHIVFVGELSLREKFAGPDLADLQAQITARHVVSPMPPHEALAYLRHRLHLAGTSMPSKVPRRLAEDLVALGHGRPSRLNSVASAIAEQQPNAASVTSRDIRIATARMAAADWTAITFIAYHPSSLNVRHLLLSGGMAALAVLGIVALPGMRQSLAPIGRASASLHIGVAASMPVSVTPRSECLRPASSAMFAAPAAATPALPHQSTAGAGPTIQPCSTAAVTTSLSNAQLAEAATPPGAETAPEAASSVSIEAGPSDSPSTPLSVKAIRPVSVLYSSATPHAATRARDLTMGSRQSGLQDQRRAGRRQRWIFRTNPNPMDRDGRRHYTIPP